MLMLTLEEVGLARAVGANCGRWVYNMQVVSHHMHGVWEAREARLATQADTQDLNARYHPQHNANTPSHLSH